MHLSILFCIFCFFIFTTMNPLQGRPVIWPDLFAEDRELYGSEKEEKFPSTFPLYQIEDWDGHYSRRILFLYKYTRYPRYERTSFFPFYDRIQSRLDGRRRSWSLLHYWREEKGYQYLAWWPVLPFVRYREQKGELSRNGWFPFYSYSRHAADHSILSVPTLPFLYYRRIEKQKRSHNVLGFINVTYKDNRISSYYVAPFVFHKGGEGGHTITPFYYHSRPRPGDHSLLIPILPLVYYSTKDSNVLYRDPASGLHTVREETSGTFFHRRRRITRLAGATDEAPGPSGILAEEFMAGLFWLFPLYSREIRPGYSYINYFLWLATREDSPQKFSSYSPFHRTYRAKIKSDQLRSIDQFSLFYIPVMRKKVTQEYASTLSPFHYRYRLLDPERRRDKEAPIKKFRASVFYLPIYQRTTYSDREEAVAAFGLYKNTTADNPSRNDHFRILPFYYKNVKDGRGRSWIAPFWFSGWEGSRRWFFFFPFYYSHKEQGDLAKGEAVTTRVVSLWKREVKIRPGPGGPVTSRSVSIPTGIPFLYAHESTTGERSYTRWFNVVKEEDRLAETSSFRVWPFYSRRSGKDYKYTNYFLWLAVSDDSRHRFSSYSPFRRIYQARTESDFLRSIDQYSFFYIPLWRRKETDSYASSISPFHYHYAVSPAEKLRLSSGSTQPLRIERKSLFFIPLHQKSEFQDRQETVAALGMYRRIKSTDRRGVDYFRLVPFYYRNANGGKEIKWAWPIISFLYWKREGRERSFLFLPFYYSRERTADPARGQTYERKVVTLWTSHRRIESSDKEDRVYRRFAVPSFLPIFYVHESATGGNSYTRYFNTIIERDTGGQRLRTWIIPFYFARAGKAGYTHIPVVYHRNQGKDEIGCTYGLLGLAYLRCLSREKETTTAALGLYFRRKDHLSKSERNWILPLYNTYESPEKKTSWYFPLQYEKETPTEHYKLRLIASVTTGISVVSPTAKLKQEGDTIYFDYELAVLGNLFSWEQRLKLKNPLSQNVRDLSRAHEAGKLQGERVIRPPEFRQKFKWNKEDYSDYHGWSLFFGWISFKYADGYHHSRVLPFYWETIHESQKNLIRWHPWAYQFQYGELSSRHYFFPIFPVWVYGYQKTAEGEFEMYFLGAYTRRKSADGKEYTNTALWGLWKSYKNSDTEGTRLLPLYSRRSFTEGTGTARRQVHRLIAPFYYSREEVGAEGQRSKTSFLWLPLYYHFRSYDSGRVLKEETLLVFPYFRRIKGQNEYRSVLGGLWARSMGPAGRDTRLFYGLWRVRADEQLRSVQLLPFYYSYRDKERETSWKGILYYSNRQGRDQTERLVPFYSYQERYDAAGRRTVSRFNWLFYKKTIEGPNSYFEKHVTTLYPFHGYRKEKRGENAASAVWFFPFHYRSVSGSETRNWTLLYYTRQNGGDVTKKLIPFYSYSEKYAANGRREVRRFNWLYYKHTVEGPDYRYEKRLTTLFPLQGSVEEDRGGVKRSTSWFLPFYYGEQTPEFRRRFVMAGIYNYESARYSRQNYFYIYDAIQDHEKAVRERGFLFSFYYHRSTPQYELSRLGYGLLYGSRVWQNGDYQRNILWAIQIQKKQDYHNSFVPFWWYDRRGERRVLAIAAPFIYYSRIGPEGELSYSFGTLGHFYFLDRSSRRSLSLYCLGACYMESSRGERGFESRGVLWNALWRYQKETENEFEKTTVLGGILYSRTRLKGREWRRVLGIKMGKQ